MQKIVLVLLGVIAFCATLDASARSQHYAKPNRHHVYHKPAVQHGPAAPISLRSASALVLEQPKGAILFAQNATNLTPIASITKLMTAMVTLDSKPKLDEEITITAADVDTIKGTHSRLITGATLQRQELLRLALMSSENRAAAALARSYPGGRTAFINKMNEKAQALGMDHSHFVDPAGLSRENISTAQELAKMVAAASGYSLITQFTTTASHTVDLDARHTGVEFRNTNRLIQAQDERWDIELSKTGYTAEAGRCLVMKARIAERPVIIVLLDAWGNLTPIGDANRIKRWIETRYAAHQLASTDASVHHGVAR